MPIRKQNTARRGKKPMKQATLTFRRSDSKPKSRGVVARERSSDEDSDSAAMQLVQSRRDEEDVPLSSPIKKRKIRVVDSDEEAQVLSVTRKAKSVVPLAPQPESDVESENSSPPLTRKRRKLFKGKKPVSHSDSEDDDLDEDLVIESRLRTRGKMTAFQKNLEKLKRKKQGKSPVSEHSDSEPDSDDNLTSEEDTIPFEGARSNDDHASLFGSDDGESDWIVEDDGNATALLPTQFSMEAHQDLSHHFKVIFQFFVHIAVRPGVDRHDFMEQQMKREEYFSVPLTMARRKIVGLRDSLVASSVWRPDFKKSLETYPEFTLTQLDFAVPACDACHLGGRMSTLNGRLSGTPYDGSGFEDISSDSSDSDDSESERPDTVEYQLGRFCARRTRVFHSLTHWEYSLFKTILQEVDELHTAEQGGRSFVKVGYAGGKTPPEDLEDADSINEWLVSRGMFDMEWGKLKDLMESARNLDIASKRGEED